MLRWEDAGSTGIVFGAAEGTRSDAVPGAVPHAVSHDVPQFVRDCAVPIVLCSGAVAAVRGTATLIQTGNAVLLLTAAHLFDQGVRLGDLMLPLPATGGWQSLESAGLRSDVAGDIAVVTPSRRAQAALAGAWCAVPLAAVAGAEHAADEHLTHYVAGYPAALTRLHEEWLVAKRLLVMSGELAPADRPHAAGSRDLFLEYRRVAPRMDGHSIHTPPLDGVSGAAVWGVRRVNGCRQLMIVGVQSAFCHHRYLRAGRISPWDHPLAN